jgi:hypothetical protein
VRAVLIAVLLAASAAVLPAAPARADARVSVSSAVDPAYATTITVRGSGFQSVRGGHGGVYVFFGTVRGGWRPSQGGQTGVDYFYVPDSEASDNQGHQRYIAFPGSDTAGSASGTMTANGAWSTTLVVPGATFQALDRDGNATTIDCRTVTCGVITVGAHGVVNARNETFTPVRVERMDDVPEQAPTPSVATGAPVPTSPTPQTDVATPDEATAPPTAPTTAPANLEVDRGSAHPGSVLAFAATGLPAGGQVSAVLDDGAAGAGPFLVGGDGGLAGVLTLPTGTAIGTHQLRLFGSGVTPTVSFAVTELEATAVPVASVAEEGPDRWGPVFAGAAALVFLLALLRLARARRAAHYGAGRG